MKTINWKIGLVSTKQPEGKNKAVDWKCFNSETDKNVEGTNVISDDVYSETLTNEEILDLCFKSGLNKEEIESMVL